MFENPTGVPCQKFYNKCSENSRSQMVFRTAIFQKLTLGTPDYSLALHKFFAAVTSANKATRVYKY